MNLSLFIAKRFFFSKKKSFINFLSITAFLGVLVGTSSLIIVLSVFNGLEDLLKSLYINFNPEIKIVSNNSKYFIKNEEHITKINKIEGVDFVQGQGTRALVFVHEEIGAEPRRDVEKPEFSLRKGRRDG